MGMFDIFKKKKPAKVAATPKAEVKKSEKDLATERREPYVNIVTMDVDPENLSAGSFELDWNDIFVAKLVKAGYMMGPNDTDADIVDRWFTNICRNVVLETYEQEQAMNVEYSRVVKTRNVGGGMSEVS